MQAENERRHYGGYFASNDWVRTFAVDKSTGYLSSSRAARHMSSTMPHSKVRQPSFRKECFVNRVYGAGDKLRLTNSPRVKGEGN